MYDLKKFRKDNGLTQKNTALYFGVTQAFISQLELGNRPIPQNFISKIKADPSMKMIIEEPVADYKNGCSEESICLNCIEKQKKIESLERELNTQATLIVAQQKLINEYEVQLGKNVKVS